MYDIGVRVAFEIGTEVASLARLARDSRREENSKFERRRVQPVGAAC